MLLLQISEHKLGMFIEGDYHDLDMLYRSLDAVISSGSVSGSYASENYLYSMMYDIRKAMNGKREFDLFQNQIDSEVLKELNVSDDINIYYGFHMLLSDLMFTVVVLHSIDSSSIDALHYHYIQLFLVLLVKAFEEEGYDTTTIKSFISQNVTYSLNDYYHQYVEMCTLRLIECEEAKRLDMALGFIQQMIAFDSDYQKVVEDVNSYADENKCEPTAITLIDSLEDIVY